MDEKQQAKRRLRRAANRRRDAEAEYRASVAAASKAGLTQAQTAEQLGVTQQAVAKLLKTLTVMLLLLVVAAPALAAVKATPADPAPYATMAHTRLVLPDGSTPWPEQAWVNEAKVPTPPVTIDVVLGGCPVWSGEAIGCSQTHAPYTIWFDRPNGGDRFTFLHELGHIFDAREMTDADHRRFIAIMRDHQGWWTQDPGTVDYANPAERFANAYALCAEQRDFTEFNGRRWAGADDGDPYGYAPTLRQHRKVCALIRQVATRGTDRSGAG